MMSRLQPPKTFRTLQAFNRFVTTCERCPRLRQHCQEVARVKRRAFLDWEYWGRPVPGFGDSAAQLWIVGLAPAAHGANRTGRMFTGDSSGDWLFRALHRYGFASSAQSVSVDDGTELIECYISASVHCAPPLNKPSREEIEACAPYLLEEFRLLQQKHVILALGQIAFNSVLGMLRDLEWSIPRPKPKFGHNALYEFYHNDPNHSPTQTIRVLTSYHPSRQNTQTGRLTEKAWHQVFQHAKKLIQLREKRSMK